MEERMRRLLPLSLRRPVFGLLAGAYPKADWAPRMFRAKSTFEALGRDPVEAYFHGVSILRDGMRRRLFTGAFRTELGGYNALEVFRRHAAERADRRPAGADPVPRPQDLSGRRHQHQGRPREHGALARSARAADGPPAGRVAGDACRRRSRCAARKGNGCSRKRSSRACRASCSTGRRWALPCRWRAGSAARCASACARRCWASASATRECSTAATCRSWSIDHQSGRRDYSASLWTLLMFDAFLRNVADVTVDPELAAKAA